MSPTPPTASQWLVAAASGHVETLAQLLSADHGLMCAEDGDERRAIYHAALGGHAHAVHWLLAHGARLDDDEKPLAAAFIGGHARLVDDLVGLGAPLDPNYSINGRHFPAWLGAEGPSHMVASALKHASALRWGSVHMVECFWMAARVGNLEKLDAFLDSGVDINPNRLLMLGQMGPVEKNQVATLDRVVRMGYYTDEGALRFTVATLLKAEGADWMGLLGFFQGKGFGLVAKNPCSIDLMHGACSGAGVEAVRFLLSAGVSPNYADFDGNTPLHWVGNHHAQAVELAHLLLDAGADPCRLGEGGGSVLHQRLPGNDLGLLDRYLAMGVSLHAVNNKGDTPLHVSARQRDGQVVCERMIALGADPFAPNKEGVLPGDDNPTSDKLGAHLRALGQQLQLQRNTPSATSTNPSRRM